MSEHLSEIDVPEDVWADVLRQALIQRREPVDLLVEAWRAYVESRSKLGGYCRVCLRPSPASWRRLCDEHLAEFQAWRDGRRRWGAVGENGETVRSFIEMKRPSS